MSRQYWVECLSWATSSGTAVASTTTETALGLAITMTANFLADGRSLRVKAFGQYSNTGTPTMIFGLRHGTATGGVLLAKSATVTTPSGVTAVGWELEIMVQVRSNGATGTVMANGHAMVFSGTAPTVASATGAAAVAPMTNGGVTTPAVATCDFTADTAWNLTLTWSASSASNTATLLNYTIEALN